MWVFLKHAPKHMGIFPHELHANFVLLARQLTHWCLYGVASNEGNLLGSVTFFAPFCLDATLLSASVDAKDKKNQGVSSISCPPLCMSVSVKCSHLLQLCPKGKNYHVPSFVGAHLVCVGPTELVRNINSTHKSSMLQIGRGGRHIDFYCSNLLWHSQSFTLLWQRSCVCRHHCHGFLIYPCDGTYFVYVVHFPK